MQIKIQSLANISGAFTGSEFKVEMSPGFTNNLKIKRI